MADFPTYDGLSRPDDFIAQCRRLGDLGGFNQDQLGKIVATRCSGEALRVINETESLNGGLTFKTLCEELMAYFSDQSSTTQAAMKLSRLRKHPQERAREYGVTVRRLIRQACPGFFGPNGQVKNICKPSYNAALYRHFVAGLDESDITLLSRLKVTTFEGAIDELSREESLQESMQAAREASSVGAAPRSVHWASPVRRETSPLVSADVPRTQQTQRVLQRQAPNRSPSPGGDGQGSRRQQQPDWQRGPSSSTEWRGRSPSPADRSDDSSRPPWRPGWRGGRSWLERSAASRRLGQAHTAPGNVKQRRVPT